MGYPVNVVKMYMVYCVKQIVSPVFKKSIWYFNGVGKM